MHAPGEEGRNESKDAYSMERENGIYALRLNKTIYLISNAFDFKDIKAQKHLAPYYLYKIKP